MHRQVYQQRRAIFFIRYLQPDGSAAQRLRSGHFLCPGIRKAFVNGTMGKKYLVHKRKEFGWKVFE